MKESNYLTSTWSQMTIHPWLLLFLSTIELLWIQRICPKKRLKKWFITNLTLIMDLEVQSKYQQLHFMLTSLPIMCTTMALAVPIWAQLHQQPWRTSYISYDARNLFTYSGFEFQRQIFHFSIKFFCKTQNLNQEKNLFHKEIRNIFKIKFWPNPSKFL